MKLEEAGYRAQDKAVAALEAEQREAATRATALEAARQTEATAAEAYARAQAALAEARTQRIEMEAAAARAAAARESAREHMERAMSEGEAARRAIRERLMREHAEGVGWAAGGELDGEIDEIEVPHGASLEEELVLRMARRRPELSRLSSLSLEVGVVAARIVVARIVAHCSLLDAFVHYPYHLRLLPLLLLSLPFISVPTPTRCRRHRRRWHPTTTRWCGRWTRPSPGDGWQPHRTRRQPI